jgi:hypothetical protein
MEQKFNITKTFFTFIEYTINHYEENSISNCN